MLKFLHGVCFSMSFILYLMRLRLVGTITLLICFPYWWRTHSSYCSRTSCFNRMAHQLIQQSRRKNGWLPTLQILLPRTSGHQTHRILIRLTTASGARCWQPTKNTVLNQPLRLHSKLCCRQYGTTCHKTPLIRLSWGLENGCGRV